MPRYLDLGNYGAKSGAPYTVSSNLLYALSRSLDLIDIETNFKLAMDCSRVARSRLHKLGLDVLGNDKTCSPAIVTFKLPEYIYSIELGERLEELNVHLSYRSDYLASRNLMQYAFMGEYSRQDLDFALFQLEKSLTP